MSLLRLPGWRVDLNQIRFDAFVFFGFFFVIRGEDGPDHVELVLESAVLFFEVSNAFEELLSFHGGLVLC